MTLSWPWSGAVLSETIVAVFTVGAAREIVAGFTVVWNVTLPLALSVGNVQVRVLVPVLKLPPLLALPATYAKPVGIGSVITALVTGPLVSV